MSFRSVSQGNRNKNKNKQMGHQTYKLLHSKGNLKQIEKTTYRREKIFANDETDKGLISKIYKQLIQLNIKKQINKQKQNPNNQIKK